MPQHALSSSPCWSASSLGTAGWVVSRGRGLCPPGLSPFVSQPRRQLGVILQMKWERQNAQVWRGGAGIRPGLIAFFDERFGQVRGSNLVWSAVICWLPWCFFEVLIGVQTIWKPVRNAIFVNQKAASDVEKCVAFAMPILRLFWPESASQNRGSLADVMTDASFPRMQAILGMPGNGWLQANRAAKPSKTL